MIREVQTMHRFAIDMARYQKMLDEIAACGRKMRDYHGNFKDAPRYDRYIEAIHSPEAMEDPE